MDESFDRINKVINLPAALIEGFKAIEQTILITPSDSVGLPITNFVLDRDTNWSVGISTTSGESRLSLYCAAMEIHIDDFLTYQIIEQCNAISKSIGTVPDRMLFTAYFLQGGILVCPAFLDELDIEQLFKRGPANPVELGVLLCAEARTAHQQVEAYPLKRAALDLLKLNLSHADGNDTEVSLVDDYQSE